MSDLQAIKSHFPERASKEINPDPYIPPQAIGSPTEQNNLLIRKAMANKGLMSEGEAAPYHHHLGLIN